MIESIVLYLTILIGVSGAVTTAVEALKPTVQSIAKDNADVYNALMIVARFLVSTAGIIMLGGVDLLRGALPEQFLVVPDFGIIIISGLFVAAGADFLHGLRDYLYALRDSQRAPETEEQPVA